ncbi:MAG: T9SS type A sorting domain-containing protein [Cytophagaceae bacterium]
MKKGYMFFKGFFRKLCIVAGLSAVCHGVNSQNIAFHVSSLKGLTPVSDIHNATSLQFGPDGKLYVGEQNGRITRLTIQRNGPTDYEVTEKEVINLVRQIPNHYDDGTPRPYNINNNNRQVTGILVTGTADNPIIYAGSSDPWHGAGASGSVNLCTNSGVVSKLYREGGTWKKIDLVRGLPRSEENHANNGMQIGTVNGKTYLYVTVGGMTNAGGPSQMFAYTSEYALSACILSVDLDAIEAMPTKGTDTNHPFKYDLPTLDDPTRPNKADGSDEGDPWGGNKGLNMAIITEDSPVQVYVTGLRNPYDVLVTEDGRMYTIDNAANVNWGGPPVMQNGKPVNNYNASEPGSGAVVNYDPLFYVGNINNYTPGSFYGGHPHPIRSNPHEAGLYTYNWNNETGVWRTTKTGDNPLPSDWPPLPDSKITNEVSYLAPGQTGSPALLTFKSSTNGLCEYTASNFNGGMQGNILAVGYNQGMIFRVRLNEDGTQALNALVNGTDKKELNQQISENIFGQFQEETPLDITAQGDNDIFPGTVWTANYRGIGTNSMIMVFEPDEDFVCTNQYDWELDDDNDCYSNADEIDNNSNPCSAASTPPDLDGDCLSDLNDPDDDGDGIPDIQDAFARDAQNGMSTNIPLDYPMYNNDPGTGFFGLGFTGIMINNETDYLDQYETANLVAGGATGLFTVVEATEGDAYGDLNNQENAFQFGINVNGETQPFAIEAALGQPFFEGQTPTGDMAMGIFIGNGDQDNYLKIALHANDGNGGIQIVNENAGTPIATMHEIDQIPQAFLHLILEVHPSSGVVQPKYRVGNSSEIISLGDPITLQGAALSALQDADKAMAVGFISTSRNGYPYSATIGNLKIHHVEVTSITPLILQEQKIVVYPNPFYDGFKVKMDSETYSEGFRLVVYNNMGAVLKEEEMPANFKDGLLIPLDNQAPGIYYLKLISPEGKTYQTVKLIKLNH